MQLLKMPALRKCITFIIMVQGRNKNFKPHILFCLSSTKEQACALPLTFVHIIGASSTGNHIDIGKNCMLRI